MNKPGAILKPIPRKGAEELAKEARKYGPLDATEKPNVHKGKDVVETLKTVKARANVVSTDGRVLGVQAVNWSAAFLLYSRGMGLEEIARKFEIRIQDLKKRCRSEEWDELVKMTVATPPPVSLVPSEKISTELAFAAERVRQNREEAIEVALSLRKNIRHVLAAYSADGAFMRPDDILTLAKASKVVDENSMLAMGDERLMPGPNGRAANGDAKAALPAMNIFMPGVLIDARNMKEMKRAQRTVEEIAVPTEVSGPMAPSIPDEAMSNEPQPEEEVVSTEPTLPKVLKSAIVEVTQTDGARGFAVDFNKLSRNVKVDDEE